MSRSSIEWTQATWNPIVGCSIVSPGCTNCYAMKMAARIEAMNTEATLAERRPAAPHYDGTTHNVNGNNVWTGKLARAPEKSLTEPLRNRRPTTYFVNSMSDLFHEDVPDEWIDQVFAIMALSPRHRFQILTKRAKRMREYMERLFGLKVAPRGIACPPWSALLNRVELSWNAANPNYMTEIRPLLLTGLQRRTLPAGPLPNVWLGVSTERQKEANERIPDLLATPAAVRFISAEPLLGPIMLHALNLWSPAPSNALRGVQCVPDDSSEGYHNAPINKLDWVIVGGESGPGSRPMHPDWARSLRDQCAAAGVPFFFKQWGNWYPVIDRDKDDPSWTRNYSVTNTQPDKYRILNFAGGQGFHGERVHLMQRYGKKAAGRLLDGCLHDEMPAAYTGRPSLDAVLEGTAP